MKKLLAFFLSMSIVLSCMAGVTFVAHASVMEDNGITGLGTSESPYIISTPEQFAAVFGNANTTGEGLLGSSTTYFNIVNDIDLTGTGYHPYTNTYVSMRIAIRGADMEGNDVQRTINLGTLTDVTPSVNSTGTLKTFGGLICLTGTGSLLKNLTVKGNINAAGMSQGCAAIVGYVNGGTTFENVINEVNITGPVRVGGFVGSASNAALVFKNCENKGTITSPASSVGGFVGYSTKKFVINNSKNSGAVSGQSNVGGLVGYALGGFEIIDSSNSADVTATTSSGVGGIAGYMSAADATTAANYKFDGCVNTGKITAKTTYAGGIAGIVDANSKNVFANIVDSHNTGDISGTTHLGGIVGSSFDTDFDLCSNEGNIQSTNTTAAAQLYLGGISGQWRFSKAKADKSAYTLNKTWNSGSVAGGAADSVRMSGMMGMVWRNVDVPISISNVFSIGEVKTTATSYVGGVIGGLVKNGSLTNALATTMSGIYDMTGKNVIGGKDSGSKAPACTSVYVAKGTVNYGTAATKNVIAGLTKSDAIFKDSKTWETNTANGYAYPQLVGNPGIIGLSGILPPSGLKVDYKDGQYILTWESNQQNVTYTVYDGETVLGTTSEKSYVVDFGGKESLALKVSMTIDGEEYISDVFNLSNEFEGGIGTKESPYQVKTGEQFAKISDYPSAHFVQIDDIDVSAPVCSGSTTLAFTGSYNGQGNSITMNISSASAYVGLFTYVSGSAEIKDLVLEGSVTSTNTKTTTDGTGSLVGYIVEGGNNVVISGITNNAAVTGYTNVGGIIGRSSAAAGNAVTIENCKNTAVVSGNAATNTANANVGGIAGYISTYGVKLINCHNSGAVKSYPAADDENVAYGMGVGGIVGWNCLTYIDGCSNTGNIYAYGRSGGIVGYDRFQTETAIDPSTYGIYNTYNAGTVRTGANAGNYMSGAIAGFMWPNEIPGDTIVQTYENVFNAGAIYYNKTTKATKGAIAGVHYAQSHKVDNVTYYWAVSLKVKGYYDTQGMAPFYTLNTSCPTPVFESAYSLNGSGLPEGMMSVAANELATLTSGNDAVFSDKTKWTDSDNNSGWIYPQIVGNQYVTPVDLKPYALSLEETAGRYTLSWSGKGAPEGYEVYIDGALVATVTEKSIDVTDFIKEGAGSAYVVALATENRQSDVLGYNTYFAGGAGTASDPYKVATAEQFAKIETAPSAHYIQVDDFTVTDYIFKTYDTSDKSTVFSGSYDGNDYSVTLDIKVTDEIGFGIGLFGNIYGATIENVTTYGTIESTVTNEKGVAAIVGSSSEKINSASAKSHVLNCVNYATVKGINNQTAGIIGRAYGNAVDIKNCVNYGLISGYAASGIAGVKSTDTTITKCANFGKVDGSLHAAGICAWVYGAGITECYNLGSIEAGEVASGIAVNTSAVQNTKTTGTYYMSSTYVIDKCFNAGPVYTTTDNGFTTGIVAFTKDGATTVSNSYNAVTADYPITNRSNEEFAAANTYVTETRKSAALVTPHDNYYLADSETDQLDGTTVKDRDGLKAVVIDGFVISGDYLYPQLSSNKIPGDKDAVDFTKVTVANNAENGSLVSFKYYDDTSIYAPIGTDVIFAVEPAFGYKAIFNQDNEYIAEMVKAEDKAIPVGAIDTTVSITEEAIDSIVPEEVEASSKVLVNDTPVTVDEVEYTRYAIVAGRVDFGQAVKVKEFGMLIAEEEIADEEFVYNWNTEEEDGIRVAKANSAKIAEDGIYGILIHGKNLKAGKTYYVRPYAIYEDKFGGESIRYGNVNPFDMADPAVDAE